MLCHPSPKTYSSIHRAIHSTVEIIIDIIICKRRIQADDDFIFLYTYIFFFAVRVCVLRNALLPQTQTRDDKKKGETR